MRCGSSQKIRARLLGKIFSAIKDKLGNDEAIGRGLGCGASFYKDYFYAKRCADGKILKFDPNDDKLPNITTL
ncbi:hypothetical protein [Campylobacter sp.]|uniref:hypothetical protein n=1 Tax=Campylobacter sp. TaxID=205 RepID=UPI0025EB1815|nr:hypothetical protein [Campylobacter sp.]